LKNPENYISANAIPIKFLTNHDAFKDGKIRPLHLQLALTNQCNQNCSFCSCKKTDKSQSLDFEEAKKILSRFKEFGCHAVTITGGGEQLIYPKINEVLEFCRELGLKVGLVTNGTQFHRMNYFEGVDWIRISLSDESHSWLFAAIQPVIDSHPEIDWAFSYVVTKKFNPIMLNKAVFFANQNNFTHVRIVPDLFNLQGLERIRKRLKVEDDKVIYQERKPSKGEENCLMGLLKPLVAPDGFVYPCCGVQYAQSNNRTFPESMRICRAEEYGQVLSNQIPFDGRKCRKCYYSEYNRILNLLNAGIKHGEFI